MEDSDSEEKTEDSIESPLSSCAPPNITPPRTPQPPGIGTTTSTPRMVTKDNTLDALDSMEIVVTAPTPLVQSPTIENDSINGVGVDVPSKDDHEEVAKQEDLPRDAPPARPSAPPPGPPGVPPHGPPGRPPPAVVSNIPQVVIQESEEQENSSSESEPAIVEEAKTEVTSKNSQPPILKKQPMINSSDEEELIPQKTGSSSAEEFRKDSIPTASEEFPVNFPPLENKQNSPPVVIVDEFPTKQFPEPTRLVESSSEEGEFYSPSSHVKKQSSSESEEKLQFQPRQQSKSSSEDSFTNLRNEPSKGTPAAPLAKKESSPEEEAFPSKPQHPSKSSSDDSFTNLRQQKNPDPESDTESFPPPPFPENKPPTEATTGLKRVDTADSSATDSSEEGPDGPAIGNDSESEDSSDHVPPEDLQVKQLKKLDMLKESSA